VLLPAHSSRHDAHYADEPFFRFQSVAFPFRIGV
jgi:hypothetical protein